MSVSTDLLIKIAGILASAGVIYAAINGVKDAFPTWTAAHPGALRVFNAVGSLLAAFLICIGGNNPAEPKSLLELLPCVATAVMTFLSAAGFHEAKSASDKARSGVQ